MRFVVDAQLPQLLATRLCALGHDAVHVKAMPRAGRTNDAEIASFADHEDRIVVTKDVDFVSSHVASGTPRRLLRIMTGNIRNVDLLPLVEGRLDDLEAAFARADHVELSQTTLSIHARPRG